MQTLDRTTVKLAVTKASRFDYDRVISTVSLAFARDPVIRWMYPRAEDFLTYWPQIVRAMGGGAFDHDSAYYAGDYAGGALWLPPDIHPDIDAIVEVFERSVSRPVFEQSMQLFEEMDRYHPSEPFWHLPFLGVDPGQQGNGIGSALLAHTLERIDAEHQIAALESTNIANTSLYQRFGFEIVAEIRVDGVPPMYPMVRRAR